MKVLLFYPNLYGMNMLPPAIGYFTTLLKRDGHEVKLFDTTIYEGLDDSINTDQLKADNLNARPFDDSILKQYAKDSSNAVSDFNELVDEFQPDLIAMSCTEDMYPVGVNLLKELKNRPKVVAGGVFPTFAPELTVEYSYGTIDYALMGEGDRSLPEICRRLQNNESLDDMDGLYMKKGDSFIKNRLPAPISLEEQVLPDYSLFEESRFYRPMQGKMRRMFPVTTIRGCPYSCAYCNSPFQLQIHKDQGMRFLRNAKIEAVRKEILHLLEHYQPDSFYFWADTFLAWSPSEFDEFCDMYAEFKLPFWIQTRAETVTEYRFKRLKEVGLLRVAFGLEHGNEKFRERILDRKISNDLILKNLKIVTDLGIPISVNNIMGFPTETRELAFDTIELNRQIRSDGINAYTFTPFHGTSLRTMSEELGFFPHGKLARCINKPTMLEMPQFTKDEIEGLRRCFVLYVKMPKSRWPEIKFAESLTPEGDAVWKQLREECLEKYMHFGDYAEEDDIGTVDFEKDGK
jgi:anaerobic magnesium-protoporphyrin IX monomethyl ester cyclase